MSCFYYWPSFLSTVFAETKVQVQWISPALRNSECCDSDILQPMACTNHKSPHHGTPDLPTQVNSTVLYIVGGGGGGGGEGGTRFLKKYTYYAFLPRPLYIHTKKNNNKKQQRTVINIIAYTMQGGHAVPLVVFHLYGSSCSPPRSVCSCQPHLHRYNVA